MITTLLLSSLAFAQPGLPPRTHRLGDRGRVTVTTRDGVGLHTAWRIPDGEGPFPTVLSRAPYPMHAVLDLQCRRLVRRGFACVYQDVRGRGRSEGTWIPFMHEERDGQDTLDWIRAQPWSDGQVGWLGESYLAATGWTVVPEDPHGVVTLVSRIFGPAMYASAYEDGLLRHELVTAWMALMPDSRNRPLAGRRYRKALRHRPRLTMDEVAAGGPVPWYREWLLGEDPTSSLWTEGDPLRFEQAAEHTEVPVLMVGGWSDAFIEAQVDAWERLASREQSMLVVGPWAHLGQVPSAVPLRGRRGPHSGGAGMLQHPRVMDWLQVHLQGTEPRFPTHGAITYVVGGHRWEHRPDWPPPTRERRFSALAGADRCDGALTPGEQPLARPLAYRYDPDDPLPSRGGAGLLAGAVPFVPGVKPGFVRSPTRCGRRQDVLRFESEPLQQPLHLAGRVRVELEVSTDAPDTAFGFRLLERRSGGPEFLLREGFATVALRDGGPRSPVEPGERVRLVPQGAPLEAEVQPGSRLVLVITSSSFPAVEAHPNHFGLLAEAETTQVARQQVYAATLVVPEVEAR